MKGVIKESIQEFVETKFGREVWQDVMDRAGCTEPVLSVCGNYTDELNSELVKALASVSDMPVDDVLVEFGKFWVLNVGPDSHPAYYSLAGESPRDFLLNMNWIHKQSQWDGLEGAPADSAPPRFEFEEKSDGRLLIHFDSKGGLCSVLRGQILGIGIRCDSALKVRETACKEKGEAHCTMEVIIP